MSEIKNKYGFRILLTLDDNTERTVQHSGFDKKDIAEKVCSIVQTIMSTSLQDAETKQFTRLTLAQIKNNIYYNTCKK